MKWHNHKITAGMTAWIAGVSAIEGLIMITGSIIPDILELPLIQKHRGWSHSWIPYTLLLFLSLYIWKIHFPTFFLTGCLIHLAGDMLTPAGIPVYPNKRFSLNLFKTGSLSEYLFVACLGFITLFYMGVI